MHFCVFSEKLFFLGGEDVLLCLLEALQLQILRSDLCVVSIQFFSSTFFPIVVKST